MTGFSKRDDSDGADDLAERIARTQGIGAEFFASFGDAPTSIMHVSSQAALAKIEQRVVGLRRFIKPGFPESVIADYEQAIEATRVSHGLCDAIVEAASKAADPRLTSPEARIVLARRFLDQARSGHPQDAAMRDFADRVTAAADMAMLNGLASDGAHSVQEILTALFSKPGDDYLLSASLTQAALLKLQIESMDGARQISLTAAYLLLLWRGAFYNIIVDETGGALERAASKKAKIEAWSALTKLVLSKIPLLADSLDAIEAAKAFKVLVDRERDLDPLMEALQSVQSYITTYATTLKLWDAAVSPIYNIFLSLWATSVGMDLESETLSSNAPAASA